MVKYICFSCSKEVSDSLLGKRVRCPYCGSKMLYKARSAITKIKAR